MYRSRLKQAYNGALIRFIGFKGGYVTLDRACFIGSQFGFLRVHRVVIGGLMYASKQANNGALIRFIGFKGGYVTLDRACFIGSQFGFLRVHRVVKGGLTYESRAYGGLYIYIYMMGLGSGCDLTAGIFVGS